MIKRFIIALVLLVLIGGGLVGFNLYRNHAIQQFFANMPAQTIPVSTITVEPTSWTPEIEAIGTVSAVNGVDLSVEAAGIVSEINFQANDEVEQGQLLVQLDDAMQRADLSAAQAQAQLDKSNLTRAQELQQRQVGTDMNVDSARAAADASAAQVEKAQAAIDQRQIKAPFNGIIGIPQIQLGQYISPGTVVATLQNTDVMRVDFTIPEQELTQVKIGQPVRLGLTDSETPFKGMIEGINPKVDPQSRLVTLRARVDEPEGRLTPGQFVEVRVELPEEEGVLALPQTAVVASLYGDHIFVVVPENEVNGEADASAQAQSAPDEGTENGDASGGDDQSSEPSLAVKQVFVKTGRRSGQLVEISEGLSAGDQVVTGGQNRLNNGTPVTVDNQDDDGGDSAGENADSAQAGEQ
ncbi:efflux RND transporter periplasmic adaptor subunit [Chelativorans sp. YIM 93263]|uniref:efflux RND transporter periplasmic adaptor subunit n=1 Tax=Chelativorans sp. YIM 93263 TaxID=2906648 RepID=UPI00237944F5|nr:efflux RND transporter periplasmic adaptor subunit [Chelativorans sp. YIM 93263]